MASIVQSTGAVNGSGSPVNLVLGAAPTIGSILVVSACQRESNGATFSLNNGTWTEIEMVQSGSSGWHHRMFYQKVVSALSATTQVTSSAGSNGQAFEASIVELNGVSDFDKFISANNTGTCTGSITPEANKACILVSSVMARTDSDLNLTPASGMTEFYDGTRLFSNYRIVDPTSGSYTVGSTGNGGNSSMIGAAFIQNASPRSKTLGIIG